MYPTLSAILSAPHLLLSPLASAAEIGGEVSPNGGLVLAPSFSEGDSLTVQALGLLCVSVCAVAAQSGEGWWPLAAQPHSADKEARCDHLTSDGGSGDREESRCKHWSSPASGVSPGMASASGPKGPISPCLLSLPATPAFSPHPTGQVGTCCLVFLWLQAITHHCWHQRLGVTPTIPSPQLLIVQSKSSGSAPQEGELGAAAGYPRV